ncbi:MAG TPA: ATP-binding protein [Azonexus sp.]|nr:ATP-binding protein [Azonexus sp.]
MKASTDPFVLGRQVELLYRNLRIGQVVSVVNASLLVWVAFGQLPNAALGAWWLLAIMVAAARAVLAIRYDQRPETARHDEAADWRRRALIGAAGGGLIWAGGSLLLTGFGDTTLQLFTALVMAGMVAGAVPLLAPDKLIFRAYAWPIALAVGIGAVGPDVLHIAIVAMTIVFSLASTRSADYFHDALLDTLRLEHEKDGLVGKLNQALAIAEQSNRAKTEFLANISHELRTPLNGIVGLGELLSLEDLTADQQALLVPLRSSADDLLRSITHLIELSALEAGHIRSRTSPFLATELLEVLLAAHRPAATAKGLTLSEDIDPELPHVLIGDVEHLRQIFTHLLGNAIKFTDRGGVNVSAHIQGRTPAGIKLEFCIADTGPGISAEKLGLLGKLLVQVDGSSIRRHGGIGVGLPIARKLIELLGGKLEIDSQVGTGSLFRFTLPFALPAPDAH